MLFSSKTFKYRSKSFPDRFKNTHCIHYIGLHGTIMTDAGFFIPRILSTETCSFLVDVAVSAITCRFGGSKLLTSPMLFNVARKVSPLKQQKAVTVLTVNHYN